MRTLRALIAIRKDKKEFKIQEYKLQNVYDNYSKYRYSYTMTESEIISEINKGNNNFKTINENKNNEVLTRNAFTDVKSIPINESKSNEKTLRSVRNDTIVDNINYLPKYD